MQIWVWGSLDTVVFPSSSSRSVASILAVRSRLCYDSAPLLGRALVSRAPPSVNSARVGSAVRGTVGPPSTHPPAPRSEVSVRPGQVRLGLGSGRCWAARVHCSRPGPEPDLSVNLLHCSVV